MTSSLALPGGPEPRAHTRPITKPLPPELFDDHDTNAEMRWDSVDPKRFAAPAERLFVRNHTCTPTIDPATYRLAIHGDALEDPRPAGRPLELSLDQLRCLPRVRCAAVLECTGNGRSFFASQQGTPAPGTQWHLGAVGAVTWEGVRVGSLLRHLGLRRGAVDVMAAGLDPHYVEDGTDFGHVRRPLPVSKALDDALLAWGMNGKPLLPDHGFPLRLVVPGWVGVASIKWLGSLEVSMEPLASPWTTKWYRMTGGEWPADSPPLTVNPVRSAWELPRDAVLPARAGHVLTGRAWSGAAPIAKVEVSLDGGPWHRAQLRDIGRPWSRWSIRWPGASSGPHVLRSRATDLRGRTQPDVARSSDNGYFFDAVVAHPVRVL